MSQLVERKLFKTGESLAVTLPIAWLRYRNLRKGDRVEIVINDDLVIRAKQRVRNEKESLYGNHDLTA